MLSEIVRQVAASESGVRVVGEMKTLEGLSEAIARTAPDVVVVGSEEGILPKECVRSMYEPPHPRTLVISSDGRITAAYRLRPQGVRMDDISPAGIIEAIRELSLPPPELRD